MNMVNILKRDRDIKKSANSGGLITKTIFNILLRDISL